MGKSKPIIGLLGGIGSGKSSIARFIADEFSGARFDADALARALLDEPEVKRQIEQWWGGKVLDAWGAVDRRKLAAVIFADESSRRRLEGLIHPIVARGREAFIERCEADPGVKLIVLDVPLLAEVGLNERCDWLIFVKCDRATRLARVAASRGWDEAELARREKNQWPLDRKLDLADDVVDNSGSQAACLAQTREVVQQFLKKFLMN